MGKVKHFINIYDQQFDISVSPHTKMGQISLRYSILSEMSKCQRLVRWKKGAEMIGSF